MHFCRRSLSFILQCDGACRTNPHASAAAYAPVRKPHYLWVCLLAFRIVAPWAPQGAAFHEYSRTDARPVMDGIFHYVEYAAFQCITSCSCLFSYPDILLNTVNNGVQLLQSFLCPFHPVPLRFWPGCP